MSIEAVMAITTALPRPMADDILGYARSVQSALPEIFRDAGMAPDNEVGNQLVFLAGLKKVESLITSQFWTLDNALELLRKADIGAVRIGSTHISRGSDFHNNLKEAVRDLEVIIEEMGVADLLVIRSYSELAQRLGHGHQSNNRSN